MKKAGIIYKITNLINGKIYIGQTQRTLEKRISEHKRKNKFLICHAIKKYNWNNFKSEVIEECDTIEKLNEREKFWIAYYDCKTPKGYNSTDGGEGVPGLTCSKKTREKLSLINKGLKQSEEVKHKKSESLKKHYLEHPETKEKTSKPHKGSTHSFGTKKKWQEKHLEEKQVKKLRKNFLNHIQEKKNH